MNLLCGSGKFELSIHSLDAMASEESYEVQIDEMFFLIQRGETIAVHMEVIKLSLVTIYIYIYKGYHVCFTVEQILIMWYCLSYF